MAEDMMSRFEFITDDEFTETAGTTALAAIESAEGMGAAVAQVTGRHNDGHVLLSVSAAQITPGLWALHVLRDGESVWATTRREVKS